jgi:hypothetical protein
MTCRCPAGLRGSWICLLSSAAIASSSRRRSPTKVTPRSFRSGEQGIRGDLCTTLSCGLSVRRVWANQLERGFCCKFAVFCKGCILIVNQGLPRRKAGWWRPTLTAADHGDGKIAIFAFLKFSVPFGGWAGWRRTNTDYLLQNRCRSNERRGRHPDCLGCPTSAAPDSRTVQNRGGGASAAASAIGAERGMTACSRLRFATTDAATNSTPYCACHRGDLAN